MTQIRKRYDRQFKTAAAQVVLDREKSVRELSEELGIKDSTLRRWAHEYGRMGAGALPGDGSAGIDKDHGIVKPGKRVEEPGKGKGPLKEFRAFPQPDRARDTGISPSIGMSWLL
ncbi:transposase [Bifidobacterium mongoliense]|uniref:transposase n=1 Tax=Bifidobacterium mongoliense TaxID=518643 RepID=UPI0030EC5098